MQEPKLRVVLLLAGMEIVHCKAYCCKQRSQLGSSKATLDVAHRAAAFAFGLATTLALLGVGSSLLGKTYGQIGGGLPIAVSIVAILMGLNLLNVVKLRLPSVDIDVRKFSAPPLLQVATSPISSPILIQKLIMMLKCMSP